jgi:hypothetical protein
MVLMRCRESQWSAPVAVPASAIKQSGLFLWLISTADLYYGVKGSAADPFD